MISLAIACNLKPSANSIAATPENVIRANEIRILPGQLDDLVMFNSNSPEWVKQEGILLSTLPPEGKKLATAHLNYGFKGKFALFAHHFVHEPLQGKTLYLGILVNNPGQQPVTLDINQAASYLLEPDAPFQQKPPISDNPDGNIYSGPGIRAVADVLQGKRMAIFPEKLTIPPQQNAILMNLPISVTGLAKPVNGRSTFMYLHSSEQVYLASLAMYAKTDASGKERAPTLAEWQELLTNGGFAQPRDKTPTPPEQTSGALIYGRVAGVQRGVTWQANLVDANSQTLTLPPPETPISYVINTLRGGKLGTSQEQTAPLLARYQDTAYYAYGNYGVHYDLTIPLFNPQPQTQKVTLSLETPRKEDKLSQGGLWFRQPSWDFPYFRGTVRLRYPDEQGQEITRYLHLWHRQGQIVSPLLELSLKPQEKRQVKLDFLYPPDSVPPQVLTISTQN